MRPIEGKAKRIRELLQGIKYSIDYYQREYRWETKHVKELLDDLAGTFLNEYEQGIHRKKVKEFSHYFLGTIIISQRDRKNFIVDGQQRLTSITLLLVLVRNRQRYSQHPVNIDDLIFSESYGEKTFNLAVDEREACMNALFHGELFNPNELSESVQNLCNRYQDMEEYFPSELDEEALPYFIDWLIDKVYMVEVTAYSDEDAYTIFETMNDRGLSLSPTEMLKGYLLANMEPDQRIEANELWRKRIQELDTKGDAHGSGFLKSWLRSQYSMQIRERRKDAVPEDFDLIGTEYHRWLRRTSETLRLQQPEDFFQFVENDFDFYSRQYLLLWRAQNEIVERLEHIRYNACYGFRLQEMLLLAPLQTTDHDDIIKLKLRLVGQFIDILLTWRIWNSRSIASNTMQYAMFLVMRDIRKLDPKPLAERLHGRLANELETFKSKTVISLNQQNRYKLHWLIARLTDYIETQSGQPSRFTEYAPSGKNRYEVEHIWADHHERHTDEFEHPADFSEHRNRIGGLVLLPKKINASYGDLPYEEKLPYYYKENLLAGSLHPKTYARNPGFLRFVQESRLPFRPHEEFKRKDMEERGELYRQLAERIWNPDNLLREIDAPLRAEA